MGCLHVSVAKSGRMEENKIQTFEFQDVIRILYFETCRSWKVVDRRREMT